MLNDSTRPDTLDDVAMPKQKGTGRVGWRFLTMVLLFIWVTIGCAVLVYKLIVAYKLIGEASPRPVFWKFMVGTALLGGLTGLTAVLLLFRKQTGWVLGLLISSWAVVSTSFIVASELIPRQVVSMFRVNNGGILGIEIALLALSCFLLYLVTSQQVRRAFRIPRSWVGRALTFGGLVGAVMGAWLYTMLR